MTFQNIFNILLIPIYFLKNELLVEKELKECLALITLIFIVISEKLGMAKEILK